MENEDRINQDNQERSVEFRAEAQVSKREVSGIAVPWDSPTSIGGWFDEQFERGSIDGEGALLFWQHQEPIGKIISHEDTDEGWKIRAKISETARGDEAMTLLNDGVITKFSISFKPIESRVDEETGLVTRTKVKVRETSLVAFPAYEGANIEEVRSDKAAPITTHERGTSMENENDVAELRESVTEMERRFTDAIERIANRDEEAVIDSRSAGDVLKAIAKGDDDTIRMYNEIAERAYTGGTTADTVAKNGWVGDLTRLTEQASTLRNLFSKGNLPAEGMNVEYAQLKSNTTNVAVQAAQGDDLVYGKVSLETKTAPVKTFGGYTQLSRQEIERSSVNVLDANLRALAIAAGRAAEANMQAEFLAEYALQVTANNTVDLATTPTYADWLDVTVDAAEKFNLQGLSLDALVTNSRVFKSLFRLTASDGRPLFVVKGNNGVNTIGELDISGLKGDLASITVVLAAGLPNSTGGETPANVSTAAFVNRLALREYASPISRLQDENIVNLSKDFSVYNYAAVAHEIPAGIVPVV